MGVLHLDVYISPPNLIGSQNKLSLFPALVNLLSPIPVGCSDQGHATLANFTWAGQAGHPASGPHTIGGVGKTAQHLSLKPLKAWGEVNTRRAPLVQWGQKRLDGSPLLPPQVLVLRCVSWCPSGGLNLFVG